MEIINLYISCVGEQQLLPGSFPSVRGKTLGTRLLQILPSDWLSYSLAIGDRPLVMKGIHSQIENNVRKTHVLPKFQLVSSLD